MLAERLEKELGLEAIWKGFELHPETPPEGLPINLRSDPHIISVLENLKHLSHSSGLEIKIQDFIPNSHLSLQGAEFAREKGRLNIYNTAIFEAFFQKNLDIGDIAVLGGIAKNIGLDPSKFEKAVIEGRYSEILERNRAEAQKLSIAGVPAFIFGDRKIIGVQPYEKMLQAAQEAGV